MTQDQFNEFISETIPCALFHVEPTDLDDKTGVRLDELILLQCLIDNPQALRYKNLKWFVDLFISNEVIVKSTQLYIADYISYDDFSGKKHDGYVAFLSKEAFDEYQRNEQLARVGNPTPEYYENFENGRYEDCSDLIHFGLNERLLMDFQYYYFKNK
jgi:hypothetical protein